MLTAVASLPVLASYGKYVVTAAFPDTGVPGYAVRDANGQSVLEVKSLDAQHAYKTATSFAREACREDGEAVMARALAMEAR